MPPIAVTHMILQNKPTAGWPSPVGNGGEVRVLAAKEREVLMGGRAAPKCKRMLKKRPMTVQQYAEARRVAIQSSFHVTTVAIRLDLATATLATLGLEKVKGLK